MQKTMIMLILASLLSLLMGCTSYRPVSTEQVKQFQNDILAAHGRLKAVQIRFSPAYIQFNFSLKDEISEAERTELFYQAKDLLLSRRFQDEVLQKQFFNKHFQEERIYPQASISFHRQKNTEVLGTYSSRYYQTSDVSSEEARKLVDGYQTWSYWETHNGLQPIAPIK